MNDTSPQQELARLRARVAELELALAESQARAAQTVAPEQSRMLQQILDSIGDGVAVADERGKFLLFNPAAKQILGIGLLDTIPENWSRDYHLCLPDLVTPFPPEQLPLTRAIRGESVNSAEVIVRRPGKANPVWLSVNARPLRDEQGRSCGGVAVFRNVSARKRAERRGTAQLAVTSVLAEAATLAEATPRILEAICTSVGWDLGTIWYVEKSENLLRCVDLWHMRGLAFPEFEERTRTTAFTPGIGLPGRVWASGEAAWIEDVVTDTNFPRGPVAERSGLHGAVAFPILFNQEVTGVIEFFSRDVRQPDRDFLTMLAGLGSQIGQYIERKRAEMELSVSRERFELAVLGSRDGIWDWNLKTNTVYHSPRWKAMLGIGETEQVDPFGEWEDRLHPEDRQKAIEPLEDYFSGKSPTYEVTYRILHNDGTYRWIFDRGVALFGLDHKPYRMAGSLTDITDRKQMEQELRDAEALYHSLVETLPLAIFRKDLEGHYSFCNQRFCAAIEQQREAILGQTDYDLCPAEDAVRFHALDQQVLEGREVVEVIDEHRRSDGEQVFVHVLKSPVTDADGNLIGVQGMFWDVTHHQRAKLELERAKEAAEAANQAKSEFLANVSHEIRTPMNGIIGMTELALDTDLTPIQREYLGLVKTSAESLLAVINDILDYSKIEAGRVDLDLHTFGLRDVLGDTLRTLAARAHKKGLELACRIDPDIPDGLIGDSVRFRQIILNLVGNAIKFTERGEVVVSVAPAEPISQGEAFLHVTVRDTGIGISPEKHQAIFIAFEQADGSTTRRYGGTGLGLTIAARLVDLMCGRIWVDSERGTGSTFHFTAMFGLHGDTPSTVRLRPTCELRDMPVLIVDDNATNRMILEETVRSWRMKPTTVASGPEALTLLETARAAGEPFALVLMDSHMPDMDGFTLAQRIQQRPDLTGATLMMLTSGDQPGDVTRCRELGIASYLLKPVKQSDLLEGILTALGSDFVSSAAGRVPAPLPVAWQALRILVAEDNAVNQRLMLDLLQKRGHTVVLAGTGLEAVEQVERQEYDLVLMDVQMPEMDGFEATAAIRQHEARTGKHVPIIAMTAHAMKGDRERCLAAGMDAYVSKPIQATELFQIIEGQAGTTPATVGRIGNPAYETAAAAGIDWKRAVAHVGGDEDILRSVIEAFLTEWPKWRQSFRDALGQRSTTVLRRTAHTVKGSLNTLGATAAADLAQRLEKLGQDGNLAGADETYSQLEQEMTRVEPALRARLL